MMFGIFSYCQGQRDTIPKQETTKTDTLNSEKDRSFTIRFGRDTIRDSDRIHTRWVMLDYGISTYLHKGKMNLPAELNVMEQSLFGSSNWNLHIVQQRLRLDKKSKVNLMYGLTLEFNKYKFSNDHVLQEKQNQVTFMESAEPLKKNMLSTTYLEIPLMMNFRTKRNKYNKRFNFTAGAYAGVLLASKTKIRIQDGEKIKIRDDFNLNRVKYGIVARVGYGPVNFYATYSPSSLFKKSQRGIYDLQAMSFGVTLLPF